MSLPSFPCTINIRYSCLLLGYMTVFVVLFTFLLAKQNLPTAHLWRNLHIKDLQAVCTQGLSHSTNCKF